MIQAIQAKQAAAKLLGVAEVNRTKALKNIASELRAQAEVIITENALDLENARVAGLSEAMIDRLALDQNRIESMANSVENIANQSQVVNEIVSEIKRDDGLVIQKQRVPIGVLAMIFESRPNVVIDCSALAIKSGNAIILKGGKEASHSNQILCEIVNKAIGELLPEHAVQLVTSRDEVGELLNQTGLVDLIIPRGGESLIDYVVSHSKVPVLAHYKGLCHIYIDASAKLDKATEIVLNAKVQRPGVCNAVETLLVNESLSDEYLLGLFAELEAAGVELRLCDSCPKTPDSKLATKEDWQTEYLDLILSVKKVSDVKSACEHIAEFGSLHTEAILSEEPGAINYFQQNVDASSVMINASTRFNDGGEYQLGAELGISTTKLHAYGPMGAREMTINRHLVIGEGHIRQ